MIRTRHLLFILTILLSACDPGDEVLLRGDITGSVGYLEAGFYGIDESLADVQVTLSGEDGDITVTSDGNGVFRFTDLPSGHYHINFTKEGFAKPTVEEVLHLGGESTVLSRAMLYELPKFNTELKDYTWNENVLTIHATIDAGRQDRYFFSLYFGDETVSPANNAISIDTSYPPDFPISVVSNEVVIRIEFNPAFEFGTRYLIVYPQSVWAPSVTGPVSNKIVITK